MRALARSPRAPEILAAPGNAGIAADARCLETGAGDVAAIVDAARAEAADLVVVGPEAPLVDGAVDALAAQGITAFGPSGRAAAIEGSKLHAKELMRDAGVPTAGHAVLGSREEALEYLAGTPYPVVLKADGLAAGKGVVIAVDRGRGPRGRRGLLRRAALRRDQRPRRGASRGRGAFAARDLRRRERRPARAGAGLQADRRRRHRPQHRRDGELLPRARLRGRLRRRDRRHRPPPGRRPDGVSAARRSTACSTPG